MARGACSSVSSRPGSWRQAQQHTLLYTVTRNTLLLLKGTLHVWGGCASPGRVPVRELVSWCFLQGTDKREGRCDWGPRGSDHLEATLRARGALGRAHSRRRRPADPPTDRRSCAGLCAYA